MRRGAYLALSRRDVRDLVDEHGGDLVGALVVLAAAAAPDTGLVRGNLDDIAEIIGHSRKRTRTLLTSLDDRNLVEWTRGRGPGTGTGEGGVIVTVLDRLDARPQPVPERHESAPSPQALQPVPERHGSDTEPVPNPYPNPSPTHPRTAQVTRGNDPQTGDRRQETLPNPSDMTQHRAAIVRRAGDLLVDRKSERGELVRSRTRLAGHLQRELETNHADHLDELLGRMSRCEAAGQTIDVDAFAAVLIDQSDPSSKRRLSNANPDPALIHDASCEHCDGTRYVYLDDGTVTECTGSTESVA